MPPSFDQLQHLGMHQAVRGTEFAAEEEIVATFKIRYDTSGLLNDESTCGNIPGV